MRKKKKKPKKSFLKTVNRDREGIYNANKQIQEFDWLKSIFTAA